MATQDDKLRAKFESVRLTSVSDTTPENVLPFEALPPEIILTIFEYVPEAICELRLVSVIFTYFIKIQFPRAFSSLRPIRELMNILLLDSYLFQTSRALRRLVDEFVGARATTPLVHQLTIHDDYVMLSDMDVSLSLICWSSIFSSIVACKNQSKCEESVFPFTSHWQDCRENARNAQANSLS